jgi:integrase
MKNLKDLKNFKGNLRGADFGLFPKDPRKHSKKDIPKLGLNDVVVKAIIKNPDGERTPSGRLAAPKQFVICTVADLPDTDQQEFILGKVRQLRENAAVSETSAAGAEGVRTLSTLIKKYLIEIVPNQKDAEGTINKLNFWNDALGNLTLPEITPQLISSKKRELNKTRSGGTCNRYLGSLSALFTHAIKEWHWTSINPVTQVSRFKEDSGRIRWLTDEEREILFKYLETSESRELKDLVIFCLAIGCRKGEALGLTWDDIDFEGNQIHFTHVRRRVLCSKASIDEKTDKVVYEYEKNVRDQGLKNKSKIKVISLDDPAFGPLITILKERKLLLQSESEYVFPHDPRSAWQLLIKRTGIKDFKFHDLRHTCASYAIQAGKTLLEVAVQLGHQSLVSAKRYSHHDPKANVGTGAAVASRLFG